MPIIGCVGVRKELLVAGAFALVVGLFGLSALAEDCVWTGLSETQPHTWTNRDNWAEGKMPGSTDTAIFRAGAGNTVSITSMARSDSIFRYVGGIRVESGNVSFADTASLGIKGANCKTGTFYVAEGSTLSFSNRVGGTTSPVLVKTGKGTVYFRNQVGRTSANTTTYSFAPIVVQEGVVIKYGYKENGTVMGIWGDIRVCDGATFRVNRYNEITSNTGFIDVDKGGTVDIHAGGTQSLKGFRGEGFVTGDTGAKVTMRLQSEDCAFAGKIENIQLYLAADATKKFILQSPETVSNCTVWTDGPALAYAAGVGEFWVDKIGAVSDAGGTIPTVDEAGEPIVLHAADVAGGYDLAVGPGGQVVCKQSARTGGTFTVPAGARFEGEKTTEINVNYSSFRTRPCPQGVYAAYTKAATAAVVDVAGGEMSLGATYTTSTPNVNTVKVHDGGVLTLHRNMTAQSDKTMYVDGGTLRWTYGASKNHDFGSSDYPWKIKVGANGMTFDTDFFAKYNEDVKFGYYGATDTDPAAETDGGVVYKIAGCVFLNRAQRVKGPIAFRDGYWKFQSGAYTASDKTTVASPFGTGDLELGNMHFILYRKSADVNTPLAYGPGAKLVVSGAAVLKLRDGKDETAQSATVGEPAGMACPFAFRDGGALLLREFGTDATFDGAHGNVFVNGTVPTGDDGHVTLPIFTVANTPDQNESELRFDFSKYDAGRGLVCFDDYAEWSDDVGADKAVLGTKSASLTKDMQVAALNLAASSSASCTFTIPKGMTLSVGSGEAGDYALVALNPSKDKDAKISGYGTLDFGASRGVIACSRGSSYAHEGAIGATVKGSGGVSYVGIPLATSYNFAEVGGTSCNSTYTGGTYVHGLQLRPLSSDAFGRGRVFTGEGMMAGGQVCFPVALTVTNDFSIAGNGVSWAKETFCRGALWFCAAVTLTGNVEIRDRARISAAVGSYIVDGSSTSAKGGAGTFKGVISGGGLQIVNSTYPIYFEGANTYAGGTEILSSTLVLRGPCSAGAGPVALDNGVLRFENDVPVVFANDLEGVGTIEIAGTAPVTFTGRGSEKFLFKTLAPGSTLNLPTGEPETLVIGGTDVDIDLKGRNVTVAGIAASGTIRGGIVTVTGEICPGGSNGVGTITFAMPPVLTGTKLVIETEDGAVDKVVVSGDADLSTLALEVVQLGDIVPFSPSAIFACGGDLTGDFASVTKPARKSANYEVGYEASSVTLSYVKPGVLMIVR